MYLYCLSELFGAALVVRITEVVIDLSRRPAFIIGSGACVVSVFFFFGAGCGLKRRRPRLQQEGRRCIVSHSSAFGATMYTPIRT